MYVCMHVSVMSHMLHGLRFHHRIGNILKYLRIYTLIIEHTRMCAVTHACTHTRIHTHKAGTSTQSHSKFPFLELSSSSSSANQSLDLSANGLRCGTLVCRPTVLSHDHTSLCAYSGLMYLSCAAVCVSWRLLAGPGRVVAGDLSAA
jgi:hypothetical protein